MRVKSKTGRPVETLVQMLNSERPETRLRALFYLIWDDQNLLRAATPLIKLLRKGDIVERSYAADLLGRSGMDSCNNMVVTALSKSLRVESDPQVIPRVWAALWRMGPRAYPAFPDVLRKLKAGDFQSRLRAINTLASMGPLAVKGVPSLRKLLKDRDSMMRAGAAYALGKIGPVAMSALPVLKTLTKDTHPRVRKCAAWAVQKLRILHSSKRYIKIDKWMYYFRRDKHD